MRLIQYLGLCFTSILLVSCAANEQVESVAARDRPASSEYENEYLPINRIAPEYPYSAMVKRITGYCTIEYTVTTAGTTKDHVAIDCPKTVFIKPSIEAAKKFLYEPRTENGQVIEVPGVRNRFTFSMH